MDFPEVTLLRDKEDLNENTFLLYCAKHYDNPSCSGLDEFYDDLNVTLHLKKLFTRFQSGGVLKNRLILNHFISLFNVFDPIAASKILFFKSEEKHYTLIKTVLVYLNRCPDFLMIDGKVFNVSSIAIDEVMLSGLDDPSQGERLDVAV